MKGRRKTNTFWELIKIHFQSPLYWYCSMCYESPLVIGPVTKKGLVEYNGKNTTIMNQHLRMRHPTIYHLLQKYIEVKRVEGDENKAEKKQRREFF